MIKASERSQNTENNAVDNKIPLLRSDAAALEEQVKENQNDVGRTKPEETKFPINESCVMLTGFKTTNRCYIRSTSPTDNENYKKVINEIDIFGRTAPVLSTTPNVYSYALALRENKWCRVNIAAQLPNKTLNVQFVDYGDFCKRNQKDLRQINQRLISLPCFIHSVQLKDVMFVSFRNNYLELLVKYTNQEYKLVLDNKDRKGGNALLYNWKSKSLLNADINQMYSKFNGESNKEDVASNVSSIASPNGKKNNAEKTNSTTNSNPHNGVDKQANSVASVRSGSKTEGDKDQALSTNTTKKKTITPPFQIQALKPCLDPVSIETTKYFL